MILKPRQVEILQLLAHGKTMRDAGLLIGRSYKTVEADVKDARDTNGAESTVHLVAMAMREGVIK